MWDSIVDENARYLTDPRGYAAALPPGRFAAPAGQTLELPERPWLWRSSGLLALVLGSAVAWLVFRGLF